MPRQSSEEKADSAREYRSRRLAAAYASFASDTSRPDVALCLAMRAKNLAIVLGFSFLVPTADEVDNHKECHDDEKNNKSVDSLCVVHVVFQW